VKPADQDALFELISDLAGKYLEGSARLEEIQQLEEHLTNSPNARKIYLQYALLQAQLSILSQPLPTRSLSKKPGMREMDRARTFGSTRQKRFLLGMASVFAVLMLVVLTRSPNPGPQSPTGPQLPTGLVQEPFLEQAAGSYYGNVDLPVATVATFTEDSAINGGVPVNKMSAPMTLKLSDGIARFASTRGADVEVSGPALFGLDSADGGVLYGGSVKARMSSPNATYSVQVSNLKVVDLGTEFRVTAVDDDHVFVEVLDGEVEIQGQLRCPLYYWDFESAEDGFPDVVTRETSAIGPMVQRVPGIIGQGALAFDNQKGAYLQIQGGMGKTVGTGRFACSSGMTVEAMIISNWSGAFEDYDEIFRKEDGNRRVIFSFQNDDNRMSYAKPHLTNGRCLAFGLFLEEDGYTELEVPLDGLNGHPSYEEITNGLPHHVVATYNSFSGRKAIYIDGQLRVEHFFPKGRMILSGGPVHAVIGNKEQYNEPFNGTIDEVAYYDFALTEIEVLQHYQRAMAGKNYFSLTPEQLRAPLWQPITRMVQGDKALFNRHTAMPVLEP